MTCACWAASRPRPTANCARASRKRWPRCACSACGPHAHEALWKQLDVAYFLRHDASDIAWQTRCLHDKLGRDKPVVKSRLAPIGEGLQVTVYVKDQPDLFARICSYFDRKNFSILDAKIHTTRDGYALDTFLITDENFANNYRDIISLIEHELCEVLTHQEPLPAAARAPVAHVAHLPDHPDRRPAPGRARPVLAAVDRRQRPQRPAVRDRQRAGALPHQPAHRQDHDPGRARRGRVPDRRRRR
jgi:UTP:GlnB (protein PII) uridylyltransferase